MDQIRTLKRKWHQNVMNLLLGKNVCGSCLRLDSDVVQWDVEYVLQRDEITTEFSLKNIMLFTFGSRIFDTVSTAKFCQKCIDEMLKAYFFMQQIQDNYNHIQKKLTEITQQMKWTEQLDESGSLNTDSKVKVSIDDVFNMSDNKSDVTPKKDLPVEGNKNKNRIVLDNESLKMELVKNPEMHKYLFREINVKEPKLPAGITVKKVQKGVEMTDFAPYELLELNWANEPDYDAVIPNTQLLKQLHSNEALIMNLMEKAKTVGSHGNFKSHLNYHEISNKVSESLNLHDSLSVKLVQSLDSNEDSTDNNDLIPQDLLELKWPDEGECTTKNSMKIPVKKLNFNEALTVKYIPKQIVCKPQEIEDEISPHELLELNWNEEPEKVDVKDILPVKTKEPHNIDLAKWLQDQGMSIIKMENFNHENKKVHILNVQDTMFQNDNPLSESITTKNSEGENKNKQDVTLEGNLKETQSTSSIMDNTPDCNVKKEVSDSKDKNDMDILRCALCFLTFDEFESYKSHYKTHSVTEYAKCYKCPAKYPIIELLSEHLLLIHSENIAYCNICFAMLDQNYLAKHMTMYHEANATIINIPVEKTEKIDVVKEEYCKKCKQPYTIGSCHPHVCVNINSRCNECRNACIHEKYLGHYRKQMKKNIEIFKCIDCKFKFKSKFEIIKHANKVHLKHKPHRCKVCNVSFLLKTSLGKHNTLHHARCNNCRRVFEDHVAMSKHRCRYASDVKCEMCGQRLDKTRYQQHKLNALSATDKCVLCQKIIPIKCNMARHMLDIHKLCLKIDPDVTIFECIICERDFKDDADFSQHSWVHTGVHECHVCAKRFTSKALYETHFQMHLATQCDFAKSFVCSVCGEQLIDKYAWAHHMLSHNDYEKCQICSKYIKKDILNQHVESHELLEKKFKCPHCPLICNSHNQLELHVNRFHLQNRPYQCDICKKCFYSKYMMREHIKFHAKLEQCSLCDRKFARKGNLDIHMRVHCNATNTTPNKDEKR